eukprot:COSAG03_NODE_6315_length_1079_cov_22.123469_2_plen_85_part_00
MRPERDLVKLAVGGGAMRVVLLLLMAVGVATAQVCKAVISASLVAHLCVSLSLSLCLSVSLSLSLSLSLTHGTGLPAARARRAR